jgi:hypothetical protein
LTTKPTTKAPAGKFGLTIEHDLHKLVKHLALFINCKEKDVYNSALRDFMKQPQYRQVLESKNIDTSPLDL